MDLKVSKSQMNSQNTLQILMYYILGVHSVHKEFSRIKNIAIYNPILNKAYILNVEKIPDEIFQMVSYKVLGYSKSSYSNDWRKADPKNFYSSSGIFRADAGEIVLIRINMRMECTIFH